jgi:hypothetical protein
MSEHHPVSYTLTTAPHPSAGIASAARKEVLRRLCSKVGRWHLSGDIAARCPHQNILKDQQRLCVSLSTFALVRNLSFLASCQLASSIPNCETNPQHPSERADGNHGG